MRIFRVQCDYENGRWVTDHPQPVVEVHATGPKEAAERVCAAPLRNNGRHGELRAKVWPLGGVRRSHEILHFYSD
jgi:hypothetical protein